MQLSTTGQQGKHGLGIHMYEFCHSLIINGHSLASFSVGILRFVLCHNLMGYMLLIMRITRFIRFSLFVLKILIILDKQIETDEQALNTNYTSTTTILTRFYITNNYELLNTNQFLTDNQLDQTYSKFSNHDLDKKLAS